MLLGVLQLVGLANFKREGRFLPCPLRCKLCADQKNPCSWRRFLKNGPNKAAFVELYAPKDEKMRVHNEASGPVGLRGLKSLQDKPQLEKKTLMESATCRPRAAVHACNTGRQQDKLGQAVLFIRFCSSL